MKADFDEHRCTFLLYPFRKDVWRKKAKPIQEKIVKLFYEISKFETVYLGVSLKTREEINIDNKFILTMKYNDIWIRDTGIIPISQTEGVYFLFNAWGGVEGLYQDWADDLMVPNQMNKILKYNIKKSSLTLEGGNLTTDGQGTLIAIKSTIVNKNRNPEYSLLEIQEKLLDDLDLKKIIWINEGLQYDETGGHIDNLCVFADEKTIFLAWTDDINNVQYKIVHQAYEILKNASNVFGDYYSIIKIPLPPIFLRTDDDCENLELNNFSKRREINEKIQASYINFIFANNAVIVPQFDIEMDEIVIDIFKKHFKNKQVIPFPSREIILGGGGLHCITKNI